MFGEFRKLRFLVHRLFLAQNWLWWLWLLQIRAWYSIAGCGRRSLSQTINVLKLYLKVRNLLLHILVCMTHQVIKSHFLIGSFLHLCVSTLAILRLSQLIPLLHNLRWGFGLDKLQHRFLWASDQRIRHSGLHECLPTQLYTLIAQWRMRNQRNIFTFLFLTFVSDQRWEFTVRALQLLLLALIQIFRRCAHKFDCSKRLADESRLIWLWQTQSHALVFWSHLSSSTLTLLVGHYWGKHLHLTLSGLSIPTRFLPTVSLKLLMTYRLAELVFLHEQDQVFF